MDFAPNPDHELIAEAVAARCAPFDDEYWSHCDEAHEFPWDFYKAMADDGYTMCVDLTAVAETGRWISDLLGRQPVSRANTALRKSAPNTG